MIVFRATNLQYSTQNLYPNLNPILAALSLSTNDRFQGYKPSVFYPKSIPKSEPNSIRSFTVNELSFSGLQTFGVLPKSEQQTALSLSTNDRFQGYKPSVFYSNLYPNLNPILAILSLSMNDRFQDYKPSVFYPNLYQI